MRTDTFHRDITISGGGETVTVSARTVPEKDSSDDKVPADVSKRYVVGMIVDNTSTTSPNRITLEEYDPGAGSVQRDQSFPIAQDGGQTIMEELLEVLSGYELRVTGADSAEIQLILQDEL